jgi:hypothetical protein
MEFRNRSFGPPGHTAAHGPAKSPTRTSSREAKGLSGCAPLYHPQALANLSFICGCAHDHSVWRDVQHEGDI